MKKIRNKGSFFFRQKILSILSDNCLYSYSFTLFFDSQEFALLYFCPVAFSDILIIYLLTNGNDLPIFMFATVCVLL